MADSSSSTTAHVSSSLSTVVLDESRCLQFALKIATKLNSKNFHLWRQQVEPYINAHNLTDLVLPSRIPPQFLDDDARCSSTVNPVYAAWLQKDQMLLSWLQSTLSSEILSRVLGCTHTHQLWDRLFTYFQKQTHTKARQLRVELRALTLDNQYVQDYLQKIHTIANSLASIGDLVPLSHHIDVILKGLPSDYASVFSVVERKFGVMDIDEVEILLIAHELRLNKFKKSPASDILSLNLTHTAPSTQSPESAPSGSTEPVPVPGSPSIEPDYSSFRGGRSHRGHGGRGRGGRNSGIQCQVCSHFGHSALACWHRFNQHFQPSASLSGYSYNATTPFQQSSPQQAPRLPTPLTFGQFNPYTWNRPSATHSKPYSVYAPPSTFVANIAPSSSTGTWYPDSGASFHVTSDAGNLQQLTPFEGRE